MKHTLLFTVRIGVAAASIAAQILMVSPASAARASLSEIRQWSIDNEWVTETNGGFGDVYPYDSTLFYYTLPSRSQASALHPYFRNNYYQYYHDVPPPSGYEAPMTWQEARSCGNYSFKRPNRVTPYGYQCKK